VSAKRPAAGAASAILTALRPRRGLSERTKAAALGYLFILPAVLLFVVYFAWAIVRSFWISFTNYKFLEPDTTRFVGLQNYALALQDQWVISGFAKAAYFAVLYFPGVVLFPFLVAVVLDRVQGRVTSSVYRTLMYIPATIPAALTFRLWNYMYRPTFGMFNVLLVDKLHLLDERPQWLIEDQLIYPPLALMHWWWAIGSMTIFYLVALAGISNELYEAARLDGASELQLVRFVTLPLMRRTMLIWSLLNISIFGIAAEMLIMWGSIGGAPYFAWTWGYYALTIGLATGKMPLGYATAIGWLSAIIMIGFAALIYLLFSRERD
jgi:ABC-type sugar transport system permease subunit